MDNEGGNEYLTNNYSYKSERTNDIPNHHHHSFQLTMKYNIDFRQTDGLISQHFHSGVFRQVLQWQTEDGVLYALAGWKISNIYFGLCVSNRKQNTRPHTHALAHFYFVIQYLQISNTNTNTTWEVSITMESFLPFSLSLPHTHTGTISSFWLSPMAYRWLLC